jgi:hypothetical protein
MLSSSVWRSAPQDKALKSPHWSYADDPAVLGEFSVQPDAVFAIERKDGSILRYGECQNLFIGDGEPRLAGVVCGQHIVPHGAQRMHDGQREVFVRVKPRHLSGILVRADLQIYLRRIPANEGPGVR